MKANAGDVMISKMFRDNIILILDERDEETVMVLFSGELYHSADTYIALREFNDLHWIKHE